MCSDCRKTPITTQSSAPTRRNSGTSVGEWDSAAKCQGRKLATTNSSTHPLIHSSTHPLIHVCTHSENRGNEEVQAAIEAAHSSLMMNALTSRLQGGAPVDKNVLYADRARYFPWRPKLWLAEQKVILYSAIAQCVLLAWALLSPLTAGTQPVIWSATAGAVGNIYKQNRISPPPVRGMEVSDEEKKQGGKNIMRGAFLAFMATFSGCLLFYTAPDALAAQLNRVLPIWFYEGQTVLLTLGTTLMNLLFTSIYR